MYESFFGLSDRPFLATPQPERYFPAAAIEAARQTLYRCIERAEGACLLIGPTGSGKTLLLEVLAEQFTQRFEVAILASGRICTRRALLQAILFELGLRYRGQEEGELRLALIDHLLMDPAQSEGLLLLVDEAHTLPLRLLEELRLVGNLIRQGDPKVRLLLAGSTALEERFASPKLESFNQRIAARCYLQSFDRGETREYVRAQVHAVGGNPDQIFLSDALDAVHRATEGIPRLVNQVCDHALILACADGLPQLNKACVEAAWADLQQLPTPWNTSTAGNVQGSSHGGHAASDQRAATIEFGILDDDVAEPQRPPVPPQRSSAQSSPSGPSTPSIKPLFKSYQAENAPADDPSAVRLPIRPEHERFETVGRDSFQRLTEVERHLASIDRDFEPTSSIQPEIELEFSEPSENPFDEPFLAEEIVIDRYSASTTDALHNRPLVHCDEGRALGAMLKPLDVESPRLAIANSEPALHRGSEATVQTPTQKPNRAPNCRPATKTGRAADSLSSERDRCSIEFVSELTDASASELSHIASNPLVDERQPGLGSTEMDGDLIVVEDDAPTVRQVSVVRRQQYRQLFANLRRG